MFSKFNFGDTITLPILGKPTQLEVFCTGDSQYDHDTDSFPLNDEELACLNWFVDNVNFADYLPQILDYCNERYSMICDEQISEADLAEELTIGGVAVNISEITQSLDGSLIYPEISFYGECECDPEHGICIGFRSHRFLGISSQDWTL